LGSSLGIDPISDRDKICSFDCVYCQLGKTTKFSDTRKKYIAEKEVIAEINSLPTVKIDYITFSGRGEPTLAKNLGKMIKQIKKSRKEKIAVITNSSLLGNDDVIKDLSETDFVIAKFDAFDQRSLSGINRPMPVIKFDSIIKGIKKFKSRYPNKFALQIMFIKDNIKYADEIAHLAREINPNEVQINTPLRQCAVKPLSKNELNNIKKYFNGLNVISVYDIRKKTIRPISSKNTLKRRGKT